MAGRAFVQIVVCAVLIAIDTVDCARLAEDAGFQAPNPEHGPEAGKHDPIPKPEARADDKMKSPEPEKPDKEDADDKGSRKAPVDPQGEPHPKPDAADDEIDQTKELLAVPGGREDAAVKGKTEAPQDIGEAGKAPGSTKPASTQDSEDDVSEAIEELNDEIKSEEDKESVEAEEAAAKQEAEAFDSATEEPKKKVKKKKEHKTKMPLQYDKPALAKPEPDEPAPVTPKPDEGVHVSVCAKEDQYCSCNGTVLFGMMTTKYIHGLHHDHSKAFDANSTQKSVHGVVKCAPDGFDGIDPFPGQAKRCWCKTYPATSTTSSTVTITSSSTTPTTTTHTAGTTPTGTTTLMTIPGGDVRLPQKKDATGTPGHGQ
eukprot:TRINITY_DN38341_c0_g1_i1.p1 TRINITY_DN38341_c0_g1~~TRINITY_DN38341_c0_g1_i1.p1  ORF type:complete len:371 (-),score=88.17 TRINITY_DN38341_c0_g1_i1:243-1355(-)